VKKKDDSTACCSVSHNNTLVKLPSFSLFFPFVSCAEQKKKQTTIGGIQSLLETFYGFLRRKTDFYTQPQEARKMVLAAFEKQNNIFQEQNKCNQLPVFFFFFLSSSSLTLIFLSFPPQRTTEERKGTRGKPFETTEGT
jgi:hypothetical protein